MNKKIVNELIKYGIPVQVKGFKNLVQCIEYLQNGIENVTDIYKLVSNDTGYSEKSIERNVRTAITISNNKNNTYHTNKEFMYLILYTM